MKILHFLIVIASVGLMTPFCQAGELKLVDGRILTGLIRESNDKITVQNNYGLTSFPRRQVRSWTNTLTEIEFLRRQKNCDLQSINAMIGLADWAQGKKLHLQAKDLYQKVLDIDPDQKHARAQLGFHKVNGKWLSEDDYQRSLGKVKLNGDWVSPEVARKAAQQRKEAAKKRQADKAMRTVERKKAAETKAKEKEAKRKKKRVRRRREPEIIIGIVPGRTMRNPRLRPGIVLLPPKR